MSFWAFPAMGEDSSAVTYIKLLASIWEKCTHCSYTYTPSKEGQEKVRTMEQQHSGCGAILQTLRNNHWTAAALRTLQHFFTLLEKTIELQHWGLESNSSRGRQAGWKQQGGHRDLTMTVVGFTVLHSSASSEPICTRPPFAVAAALACLLCLLALLCFASWPNLHALVASLLATRGFFWGFFSCPLDEFFFSFDILAIFSNCSRDSPLYLLWWKSKGRSQSTCFFQTLVDALSLMRHKYSSLFSGTVYTVHHHQLGEGERSGVSCAVWRRKDYCWAFQGLFSLPFFAFLLLLQGFWIFCKGRRCLYHHHH